MQGQTALHWAARRGYASVVAELLSHGANVHYLYYLVIPPPPQPPPPPPPRPPSIFLDCCCTPVQFITPTSSSRSPLNFHKSLPEFSHNLLSAPPYSFFFSKGWHPLLRKLLCSLLLLAQSFVSLLKDNEDAKKSYPFFFLLNPLFPQPPQNVFHVP